MVATSFPFNVVQAELGRLGCFCNMPQQVMLYVVCLCLARPFIPRCEHHLQKSSLILSLSWRTTNLLWENKRSKHTLWQFRWVFMLLLTGWGLATAVGIERFLSYLSKRLHASVCCNISRGNGAWTRSNRSTASVDAQSFYWFRILVQFFLLCDTSCATQ